METLRRSLLAIVVGSALISRAVVAQRGASSGLTHTVTVTVPPRVKVQVAAFSAFSPTSVSAVRAGSVSPSTQGLSLNVSATQAWVLSIGSSSSSAPNANVRWSLEPGTGFSKLTAAQTSIASGRLAVDPRAAVVFFRNVVDTATGNSRDMSGGPVVLTISAP
jgi:hypothetical protein